MPSIIRNKLGYEKRRAERRQLDIQEEHVKLHRDDQQRDFINKTWQGPNY